MGIKQLSTIMFQLASIYNTKVRSIEDINGDICVWIEKIDRLYKRKYLSNLEGRGKTLEEAYIDYIQNLMNTKYQIRYNKKIYATSSLRNIIKKDKSLLEMIMNDGGD